MTTKNTPQYPSPVYDGSSPTRPTPAIDRSADAEDFDQLVAEIVAVQTHLNGLLSGLVVHAGPNLGFYGATAAPKPTVNGSAGANAALISLLAELATLGLIIDSSS